MGGLNPISAIQSALTPKGTNAPMAGEQAAGQLTEQELAWLNKMFPERAAALQRAYANLSQSGTQGIANMLGNQAQRRGVETGIGNSKALGRMGYASSVQDAAKLQGRNQGASQANNISMSLLNPQAQAQNSLTQAGLYSQAGLQGSGLQALAQIGNLQAQKQASKPPGFFESVLGAVGGSAGLFMPTRQPTQYPGFSGDYIGPRM